MKLKEVAENLVGAATKVTKLGIQEEIRHPKLIKTSTALDLRAIGLAVLHKDLKDDVVIVPESGEGKKDFSVYLVDNELTRRVAEEWYGKQLGKKGLRPIVRTKIIKRDGQDVVVLHVPLLDAQVALTHTDLGTQVPELYCGKTLDKKVGNYLTCGEEIREHYAKYVLGEELSLYEQDRLDNSKTLGGRVRNVEIDIANAVGAKVSATGQKLGTSAKKFVLVEVPKVGGVLAKSAGETLRVAGEEAILLKDLTIVAVRRGAVDAVAMTLTAELATEKVIGEVADAAQVGALDLTAAAVSRIIIFTLKKPKS